MSAPTKIKISLTGSSSPAERDKFYNLVLRKLKTNARKNSRRFDADTVKHQLNNGNGYFAQNTEGQILVKALEDSGCISTTHNGVLDVTNSRHADYGVYIKYTGMVCWIRFWSY